MTETLLAIGELSNATDVAISALRYYDEIGLIAPAMRVGGKRRFAPEEIGRVSFIKRAQRAGLSLDDVKLVLDDRSGEWRGLVHQHITELRRQKDELDVMIAMLHEVDRCGCEVVAECPRLVDCGCPPGDLS